ncbi:SAP domain-containing ribonucleoprotein [Drosophila suzukii]|uniref:SAP domain-containing ribonucleoprotein n=1 Tax=Drosophila suzukii TaxID=28584 RepID=A0AB39ZLI4_DROSZ
MPESDVTKMKVADLKRELKLRGLTVNGNKTELQDRLQTALLEGDISLEDSAIADAIDDDDVSLTDEDEHKLLGDENDDELLKSPVSTPTTVAIPELLAEDKTATDAAPAGPAKKIVLKRNNSQQSTGTGASTGTTPSKENEAPATTAGDSTEETPTKKHKPIVVGPKAEGEKPSGDKKLTQLTAQERLELRAKKFGITPVASPAVSTAASTVAVAINKSSSASITANKGNKETEEQQKEALKRRAERFGCVVPEKAPKAATDDRLQKRKERFGAGAAASEATSTATTTGSKDAWSEKARARLERFKIAPAAEATK